MTTNVGMRRSLTWLQDQYNKNNKRPLENLVAAWNGIQKLPPTHENSFFVIAGYHGEPFQLREGVEALKNQYEKYAYWGGYCAHGNVLFPLWHRAYLLRLEKALQSIVPDVMMAFWDETDDYTRKYGAPQILTQEYFNHPYLGNIVNPLRSFTLPKALSDDYWGDNDPATQDKSPYAKPAGYPTVRYPLSGLVGNEKDKQESIKHNKQYEGNKALHYLTQNITAWVNNKPQTPDGKPDGNSGPGIYQKYSDCLDAPNYTVFSNTTSASAWNLTVPGHPVTPLEDPHNDVHLAAGGFDAPQITTELRAGQVSGSNGDMGENNTAAFDPMFFFHHCNVDRMFWIWQQRHGFTDRLDIIKNYPGTSSTDSQGPTPGIAPGTPLDLDTPLNPFKRPLDFKKGGGLGPEDPTFTGKDLVNIEKQLGYTYAEGSIPGHVEGGNIKAVKEGSSTKKLKVHGIDRSHFQGSFLVIATATVLDADNNPQERLVGYHSVLSRWDVASCANCRTHLEVVAHFPLHEMTEEEVGRATFNVTIRHRGEMRPPGLKSHFPLPPNVTVIHEIVD